MELVIDGKIHIPAKRRDYANDQSTIKITPEAYNMLVDIVDESDGLSMRQVASLIITQAVKGGMIYFDKKGE